MIKLYDIPRLLLPYKSPNEEINCWMHKNIEKIKFLIENGADVNHRVYHEDGHYESDDDIHGFNYGCNCGRTALIYAVNGGHVETVKLLIENGADVNVRDCSDMNLLMYLYNTNIYAYTPSPTDEEIIAIAELLIENGVDVNATDKYGQTVLKYAVNYKAKNYEAISFLIENGADVNAIDESGQTVLDYAKKEEYDNYRLISLLVNNGALTSGQIEEQKAENAETEDYTEFSDDSFGEYEE